ncbi:hypothetical protein M446_2789 [Methylobacterium sp. 4-46]|uniref:hypothetical protein n=1 Tax=unclassified Methylobacterium TaxID=2615210 RepID=UPI000165C8B4|nr:MULTISPECIES: hypothetical protein [Methylobacterium]ACA17224.1 hypothetical protein M446_2789 [Methylobacterium sp. 4-46]WFT82906.1 hypothetical protein QA634_14125 [Methylobacterium nodulans]
MKLYEDFFHPDAQVEIVGDRFVVTLPDSRSLSFKAEGHKCHNRNARCPPCFDIRDQLDEE